MKSHTPQLSYHRNKTTYVRCPSPDQLGDEGGEQTLPSVVWASHAGMECGELGPDTCPVPSRLQGSILGLHTDWCSGGDDQSPSRCHYDGCSWRNHIQCSNHDGAVTPANTAQTPCYMRAGCDTPCGHRGGDCRGNRTDECRNVRDQNCDNERRRLMCDHSRDGSNIQRLYTTGLPTRTNRQHCGMFCKRKKAACSLVRPWLVVVCSGFFLSQPKRRRRNCRCIECRSKRPIRKLLPAIGVWSVQKDYLRAQRFELWQP